MVYNTEKKKTSGTLSPAPVTLGRGNWLPRSKVSTYCCRYRRKGSQVLAKSGTRVFLPQDGTAREWFTCRHLPCYQRVLDKVLFWEGVNYLNLGLKRTKKQFTYATPLYFSTMMWWEGAMEIASERWEGDSLRSLDFGREGHGPYPPPWLGQLELCSETARSEWLPYPPTWARTHLGVDTDTAEDKPRGLGNRGCFV